jgi:ApaG protein
VEILTTNGITITVEVQYLPQHSQPKVRKFIFGYQITIENGSDYVVQLLRRHWFIYDGCGDIREVEGEGVVGQQPVLAPGQYHQYASYCDLTTDIGKMRGTFLMVRRDDNTFFDVPVPEFKMFIPARMN